MKTSIRNLLLIFIVMVIPITSLAKVKGVGDDTLQSILDLSNENYPYHKFIPVKTLQKRVADENAAAMIVLGDYYDIGKHGLEQSRFNAKDVWRRAGTTPIPQDKRGELYTQIGDKFFKGYINGAPEYEIARMFYVQGANKGNVDANFGLCRLNRYVRLDSSLENCNMAIESLEQNPQKNSEKISRLYFFKGENYYNKLQYRKAVKCYKKSLDVGSDSINYLNRMRLKQLTGSDDYQARQLVKELVKESMKRMWHSITSWLSSFF